MSDTKTEEPSIEEILESIRQIISDEDEEGTEDGGELKGEEEDMDKAEDIEGELEQDDDEPADVEGELPEEDFDILELNEIIEEGVSAGDVEMDTPEDDYKPADIEMDNLAEDDGRVISDDTEDAAVDSFAKLAENVYVDEDRGGDFVAAPGRVTLEEMTKELLRPMLKEWLDRRLPGMVEELVQRELKKISDRSKK